MADENIQRRPVTGDQATTAAPPPALPTGPAGITVARPGGPAAPAPRPEWEKLLRWGAGLVLVLAAGWGFIVAVGYVFYTADMPLPFELAVAFAAALSLAFFVVLQRNLGLSHFMGLRTDAQPSPLKEAFFLWLLGVPGLLFRSTERGDAAAADQKTQSDVSNTREVIETVVFVVVLVLLLKSFVAEAFVIPTGSMATTLYGYQKDVPCPKCHYLFPVNCSQEVDPSDGGPLQLIRDCVCPNCREPIKLTTEVPVRDPRTGQQGSELRTKYDSHTGDRVLVGKFLYDLPWRAPVRGDVVVFKYPKEPQRNYTPLNYIKRLCGLPGETIAIYYGKLFVLRGLTYDDSTVDPRHPIPDPLDLWRYGYMHVNDAAAMAAFLKEEGGVIKEAEILRKKPEQVLAQRRLVYDNDYPADDLGNWPRWDNAKGGKGWESFEAAGKDKKPRTYTHAATEGGIDWLRYHHVLVRGEGDDYKKPTLITDFMGYNSWQPQTGHWAGDLMIDCEVKVEKPQGQLVLELSRSRDRFRAAFDLASGDCTLKQIKNHVGADEPADDAGEALATKPTGMKKAGTYHVRLANVDDRLLVWVDRDLPFGEEGVKYPSELRRGPQANDLEPAGVGARGTGVTVGKLQLWRDTYYTQMRGEEDGGGGDIYPSVESLADPAAWGPLQDLKPETFYVHPGHYLCLGDNSPHSSDGRAWGTVPERLMLGRALTVYYPFTNHRFGPIH